MPKTPKRTGRIPREGARFLADVLAENITAYRAKMKLSQRALAAEMRELGHQWSASTVSDVENGDRAVAVDELLGLALILNTNPPALLDPGGIDGNAPEALDYGAGVADVRFARSWVHGNISLHRWTDAEGRTQFGIAAARDTSLDALGVLDLKLQQVFGRKLRQPQAEEDR